MRQMRCALLLAAACGCSSPSPSPAPGPQPIANVAPAPPPPPASTCIAPGAHPDEARLVDGALVVCYLVPLPSGYADDADCWRFDLVTSAWSFATRKPRNDVAPRRPNVTATATSARACTLDGSDCKTIPLSGIKLSPGDTLEGATNIDRSIVAVWARWAPVHVFDARGNRLATIQPWAAGLAGNRPSTFREAHVLGSTIEVRIADTPISSAIRLYDARGNKIADVFGGKPMEDSDPPLELGGSRYAFISLDAHSIVITDVATGKQLGSYPLPGEPLTPNHLMRTPDGNIAGVVGATAVMLDVAAGKLSSVAAPACAQLARRMPARVLVVDRSASTRDAIADLLGEHADAPPVTTTQRSARSAIKG